MNAVRSHIYFFSYLHGDKEGTGLRLEFLRIFRINAINPRTFYTTSAAFDGPKIAVESVVSKDAIPNQINDDDPLQVTNSARRLNGSQTCHLYTRHRLVY